MTWLPLPPGTGVGDLPAAPEAVLGPDGVPVMTVAALVVPFTTRESYELRAGRGRFRVRGSEMVTGIGERYEVTLSRGAFVTAGRPIVRVRARTLITSGAAYELSGAPAGFDLNHNPNAGMVADGSSFSLTGQPQSLVFSGAVAGTPQFNTGITNITYSNNNRTVQSPQGTLAANCVTIGAGQNSGKHYCEVLVEEVFTNGVFRFGLAGSANSSFLPGEVTNSFGYRATQSPAMNLPGSTRVSVTLGGNFALNTSLGIAVDFDSKELWIQRNGVWGFSTWSGDPEQGTTPLVFGWSTTLELFPALHVTDCVITIPESFQYTPAGFDIWPG